MDRDQSGAGLAVLGAFLLGGIIGAGLALLTAPRSGRDTRGEIGRWANDTYGRAGEKLGEIGERVKSRVRHKLEEVEEKI